VLGEGAAGQHDGALLRSRLRLRLAERGLEAIQTLSVERIEATLEPGERCARNSCLDGENLQRKPGTQAAEPKVSEFRKSPLGLLRCAHALNP